MKVLDACAVIAFLRDEDGAEKVEDFLLKDECYLHIINLCEVYYDALKRNESEEQANQIVEDLREAGVIFYEGLNEIWKNVAKIKANYKIPLADCFALSLAVHLNAKLVTTDHTDFDPLANDGYPIEFIR